jgi:hypothetical protein
MVNQHFPVSVTNRYKFLKEMYKNIYNHHFINTIWYLVPPCLKQTWLLCCNNYFALKINFIRSHHGTLMCFAGPVAGWFSLLHLTYILQYLGKSIPSFQQFPSSYITANMSSISRPAKTTGLNILQKVTRTFLLFNIWNNVYCPNYTNNRIFRIDYGH